MKNLSLQMTETAALTKPIIAVNKSNLSSDNSTSAETNRSFQMMLNKQVQDTHIQNKQVQNKQISAQKNQAIKPTVQNYAEKPENPETANKNSKNANHLQHVITTTDHSKEIKEAEKLESSKLVSKELTDEVKSSLDAKLVLAIKGNDVNTEEVATHAVDTNSMVAASILAILPPALLENKQSTNVDLSSTADGVAEQKQRALGAEISSMALNNALSQGKNTYITDNDAYDLKETAEGKFLHGAKPMDADEFENSKIALNAAKEIAVKDIITPASYQPAVQIKAPEVVQQAGSSNVINVYPGKTGWDQAISQKVVWMLGASEQSATLTLNPPDMGPLQVVIHVHNDKADTTFISDNAEVRQALQDGMENLRGKLNESGIQLGQANVSSGSQMQQQFQQASQKNGMRSQLDNNSASASQLESTNSATTVVRVANGLVDTFA